jgi:hypothetical protein
MALLDEVRSASLLVPIIFLTPVFTKPKRSMRVFDVSWTWWQVSLIARETSTWDLFRLTPTLRVPNRRWMRTHKCEIAPVFRAASARGQSLAKNQFHECISQMSPS